MANSLQLPDNPALAKKVLDNEKEKELRKTEIGYLGRIWGVSSSVPNNIAALTIIVLLIVGCVLTLVIIDTTFSKYLWSLISSIISLSLGYLFGESKGRRSGENRNND